MDANDDANNSRLPPDTSYTTGTETASEYFTDAENTTTGSRTPRQSVDLNHSIHDTDAESQLYQDARSFAGVSTTSLAAGSISSSSQHHLPAPAATTPHQEIAGRLAPPHQSSQMYVAQPQSQQPPQSQQQPYSTVPTSSSSAVTTSAPAAATGGDSHHMASEPTMRDLSHGAGDRPPRDPTETTTSTSTSTSIAGIDTPTLRAHEEDPLKTAAQVPSSTKADIIASAAPIVGKEVASQEPYTVVTNTSSTIPDAAKQATATLPEGAKPTAAEVSHSTHQQHQDGTAAGASPLSDIPANLLGVKHDAPFHEKSSTNPTDNSAELPRTEKASAADAAAATAAGAGAGAGAGLGAAQATSKSNSTTINMNGNGNGSGSSGSDGRVIDEKGEHHDEKKGGLFGGSGRGKKSSKKDKKTEDKKKKKDNPEDDPELAHFTPEQKRIILAQTELGNGDKTASYFDIYKFSTKFELLLDFIGIIAAIVSGVVQPLMTLIFGNLTTAFTQYGTQLALGQDTTAAQAHLFDEVNKDALYLLYIGIGMFGTTYIYMATWIWTGETTTRRIREGYLRATLRQNVGFFDKLGAGEVTTRITSDVHLIQDGISEKVPITFQFVSQFFAGFVVAFIRNWRMTIVLSSIVPAIAGTGAVMATFQAKYRTKMLSFVAEGGSLAEEVISSVRTTHAFGTQKKLATLYDVSNLKAMYYGKKTAVLSGAGLALFFFIIYSAYALAFWWGATLLIRGEATSGEIITCFFAVLIGAFSLSQVAPNLQAIGYATGAANKLLFTIWRVPPIDSESEEGERLEHVEGTISLHNVDFYYPSRPSVKVLDNFSVNFPSGKITALVGASGSGKSSVIGLLERFYNTLSGEVRLDGHDITKFNVRWLRSQIGLVSQEPTLFASMIWENVAYGLINTKFEHEPVEVKKKMVQAACELANAHEFITNLPEGYDTQIGERGMLLSGGQKQRIAIARAIVSDPPILLLDEATSALDTQSEKLVQKALDQASTGRTTITIAHRLSTIKDAHQIVVMNKGVILEIGTHNELLERQDSAYGALVRAQALKEEQQSDSADIKDTTEEEEQALLAREAQEAREMTNIKRTGTGRSEVSDILERKRDEYESSKKPKEHGVVYLLVRLIKEISDAKWYYFFGTIFSVVLGMIYPVFAIVFGHLLGVFSSTDNGFVRDRSDYYSGLLFAIAIVSSLAIAIQAYSFGYTSEYLSRRLRLRIFGEILRQDIAFFDEDRNSTGALTSSISEQPQKVNAALGITLGVIIQNLITLIGGIIVGLSYAWRLALVGVACIPLTLSAGIVRLRVVNLKDEKTRRAHETAAQTACEAAGAIRTVASLTREKDAVEVYSRALDAPMHVSNRIALVSNIFFSITQALAFPVIALIFWYGSHQLVDGAISTQQFFTCLTAVIFGSIQAGNVFTFVPDVSSAKGAAAKIVRLFDREVEIDADNPEGKPLTDVQGHVAFRNVHFRYPTRPSVRVLRGLNLTVKPGEFVALVGPSGCGKSTIIQLIERFYDPILGTVEIDGQNVHEANVKSLRENISLVSQEPTLYDGSVRFNITLGATKEPTQEEVDEACRCANIYDFIQSLPDGFDTLVGGKGSQLSGGQKQRIAIARALIRNPKILLLDEATSALDSQSEKVVQAALDAAAKNRTTIAVAHRLSTIQNADHIFVLKDGKVAERGTHNELLHKGGIYAELVQQQALEKKH